MNSSEVNLYPKIRFLEQAISGIEEKCADYGRQVEESRQREEHEVALAKEWISKKDWRDGKFKTAIDNLRIQLEILEKRDEAEKGEYQKSIDFLQSEILKIQSDLANNSNKFTQNYSEHLEKIDDDIMEKIRKLRKEMDEIKKNVPGEGEQMRAITEWILEKEARDKNIEKLMNEMKTQNSTENFEQRSKLEYIDSELVRIREDFQDLHSNVHQEWGQQEIVNEKILYKIGTLKGGNSSAEGRIDMEELKKLMDKQDVKWRAMYVGLEEIRAEMRKQREEAEAQKIQHELFVNTTQINVQTLRTACEEYTDFRNTVIERLCFLRSNMEDIDFHARQMYTWQVSQNEQIDALTQENASLRSEFSHFKTTILKEFRLLHRETKNENTSRPASSQELQIEPQGPVKFGQFVPKYALSSSSENTKNKNKAALEYVINKTTNKVVNEVLATWKATSDLKKRDEQTMNPMTKKKETTWKFESSENFEKFCHQNKEKPHEVVLKDLKIVFKDDKMTTYYQEERQWKKSKRYTLGNDDSPMNFWKFLDKEGSVHAVDLKGLSKTTWAAERTTFYAKDDDLVVNSEMGGVVCKRFYKRIE